MKYTLSTAPIMTLADLNHQVIILLRKVEVGLDQCDVSFEGDSIAVSWWKVDDE